MTGRRRRDGATLRPSRRTRTLTPLPLVVAGVAFLAIVSQVPFVLTLVYSTLSWNLLYPGRARTFVGLANYARTILGSTFPTAIFNTLVFTVSILFGSLLLGFVLALLLHRRVPGRQALRTLLMSPFLVIVSVTTLVWRNMIFNPTSGFLGDILRMVHLPAPNPLGDAPRLAIMIIAIWEWTPFMMLILVAALSSLPAELSESAAIDGAGYFATLRWVTLPMLSKYFLICLLIGTVMILPLFGEIHLTTYGGPGTTTTNLTYLVFRQAFQFYDIGASSAAGVLSVLLTMGVATFILRIFIRGAGSE